MFSPLLTAAPRNRDASGVSDPSSTKCSNLEARAINFLMLTDQCWRVMSGMTTCRRDPSGSAASTKGEDKSNRRPEDLSIRSTKSRTCCCVSVTDVSSDSPPLATYTSDGELIQISSIEGSSSNGCNGPNPATASKMYLRAWSKCPSGGKLPNKDRSS